MPIEAASVRTVNTGISFSGRDFEGMVPLYEEYDAMLAAHYNESDWQRLAWQDKARAVAHYRLKHWIAIHQQDAVAKDAERRTKRK